MHYNTKNRKFPYTTTKSHQKTGRNKPKSPSIDVKKKKLYKDGEIKPLGKDIKNIILFFMLFFNNKNK